MPFTTKIIFHNACRSWSVEQFVRERVQKLARYYRNILSCQVVIDAPHHHHQKGNHYRVRLTLAVPGKDLVVGHGHKGSATHEDLYAAITDAFSALESQVKTFVGKQRVFSIPHRQFEIGEAEPLSLEPGSEREPGGTEYADWMSAHGAGDTATG